MSNRKESDTDVPGASAPGEEGPHVVGGMNEKWQEMLLAYAKSANAMASITPFMAGQMPFPQAFMMPGMTPFAGVSGVFPPSAAPGEDESTKHTQLPTAASEKASYTDDSETEAGRPLITTKRSRPPRANSTSVPQKRIKHENDMSGGRSQSQACALALLASAAGDVNPASSADIAPQEGHEDDVDGEEEDNPFHNHRNNTNPSPSCQGGTAAARSGGIGNDTGNNNISAFTSPSAAVYLNRGSSLKSKSDVDIETLDESEMAGMDENELKKLRRKQSNRESARRSRLRKHAECEALQIENRKLRMEVQQLTNEKLQLSAQLMVLTAKSAASVVGVEGGAQAPHIPLLSKQTDLQAIQDALTTAPAVFDSQIP